MKHSLKSQFKDSANDCIVHTHATPDVKVTAYKASINCRNWVSTWMLNGMMMSRIQRLSNMGFSTVLASYACGETDAESACVDCAMGIAPSQA